MGVFGMTCFSSVVVRRLVSCVRVRRPGVSTRRPLRVLSSEEGSSVVDVDGKKVLGFCGSADGEDDNSEAI